MKENKRTCPACGAALPESAPRGLCPKCLADLGESEPTASELRGQNSEVRDQQPEAGTPPLSNVRSLISDLRPLISDSRPQAFGDYELLEEIARGGMGVVYRARHRSLNRIVAVKMILSPQFRGKQVGQRFRNEAAAAAILRHPNIVAVHDVGVHDGQQFFSMDYVDGQNLAELVGNRPLPPARAARYLMVLAEAIDYAHSQGILHRDLKPSNVLIDSATDQPHITDFGLAKRLDGTSSLTVTGQVLGSPSFMPPEQAGSDHGKVGRPSDVYALGGLLYFLLTARAPFQAESLEAIVTQVLNTEPVSPKLLIPTVPHDLETICLKCLEKEPSKRFQTARELAQELRRFLDDEPILARPVSVAEKLWRWCRRKPVVASLSAATALLLLTVTIGSPIALLSIKAEQETTRQHLYAADMSFVQQAIELGDLGRARQFLAAHVPRHGQGDLRGFEWRHLSWNSRGDELATLQETGESIQHLSFSPNGRWLAAGNKVWEAPTSQPQFVVQPQPRFLLPTNHVALGFAPDGELLMSAGRELKRWDPLTRREILLLTGERVRAFAFSRSGKWMATGSDRCVRLWDATTWTSTTNSAAVRFDYDYWRTLAFSADEQSLITCTGGPFSRVSILKFWSVPALDPLPAATNFPDIISVAVSPEGEEFYTGSADGTLRVWDAASRTELESKRVKRYHRAWISQVVPLPDSGKLGRVFSVS